MHSTLTTVSRVISACVLTPTLSLQLTRQPVASQSPWPLELVVTSGRAWLTREHPEPADEVLTTGDSRRIAAGMCVFASGLPLATVALRPLPGSAA